MPEINLDAIPTSLKSIFSTEESASEVVAASERIRDCFDQMVKSERFRPYRSSVFLDRDLLVVAAASACIDMSRLEPFHEFDGGPAGFRRGAYLAFWVANKKPIQFKPLRVRHHDLTTMNEHMATLMAMAEIDRSDKMKIESTKKIYGTIHYGLTWDRYSARELEDLLQVFHDAIH